MVPLAHFWYPTYDFRRPPRHRFFDIFIKGRSVKYSKSITRNVVRSHQKPSIFATFFHRIFGPSPNTFQNDFWSPFGRPRAPKSIEFFWWFLAPPRILRVPKSAVHGGFHNLSSPQLTVSPVAFMGSLFGIPLKLKMTTTYKKKRFQTKRTSEWNSA